MKRVIIITATQSKSEIEFKERPIYKSLEKIYSITSRSEFDFIIVKDNKTGLSKLYNSFLQKEEHENDILVFVHDDVEIEDLFFIEKLQTSPYTVTGLAGSKKVDLNAPKPAWHLMSQPQDHVGEVAHTSNNRIWTTCFGPTNSRALVIDGLFIAVDVQELLKKGGKFNENFDFHHYDIAFCLDCNSKQIKIGVLPIRVIHHGLGDSMLTPEWEENAKKFREIYKN